MKNLKPLLASLLLIYATGAHAGYAEAKKEFDLYAPPAAWRHAVETENARAAVPPSEADRSPVNVPATESFLVPDPALLQTLSGAAEDAGTAKKIIAERLVLADLETLTLLRNPAIRSAEEKLKAAREAISITRSLNETLKAYNSFTSGSMPDAGAVMGDPPSYPYPGAAALRGEIALLEVRKAMEELEGAKAGAVTEIRKAYWEMRYHRAAWLTAEKALLLIRNLTAAAEARYRAGQGSLSEVARLKAKVEEAANTLADLSEERRPWIAKFASLLGLPADVALAYPDMELKPPALTPGAAALTASAREGNRELRAMRLDIARMETMVAMAGLMTYERPESGLSAVNDKPALTLGAAAMAKPFETSAKAGELTGTPKRPAFSYDNAYIAQTMRVLAGAREELAAREWEQEAAIRGFIYQHSAARRAEVLYRERVAELASVAFDTDLAKYQTGELTLPMVLDSFNQWLDAVLTAERKRTEMGIAAAELEKINGRSPVTGFAEKDK